MGNTPKNNETMSVHLTGLVIHGDGRGAKIGFPTANLELRNHLQKPADGVYACLAQILPDETIFRAVLHLGPRPTFKSITDTAEVHLLDFPYRDLYDCEIKIFSLLYIRQIKKFTSPQKLISAITKDINQAHQLLSNKT